MMSTNTRAQTQANSAAKPVSNTKKPKKKQQCNLCDGAIKDTEDTLHCEGDCAQFYHRYCASISKSCFLQLSASSAPFVYNYAMHTTNEYCNHQVPTEGVAELRNERTQLKTTMTEKEILVTHTQTDGHEVPTAQDEKITRASYASIILSTTRRQTSQHRLYNSNGDRKFNIVVYGIPECLKGTSRQERTNNHFQEISQIIGFLKETIPEQNVRDYMRLGSYKELSKRSRPTLVRLN